VADNLSVFQYNGTSDFFMRPVKILRPKSCLSSHIEISCHFSFLGDVILVCGACLVPHTNGAEAIYTETVM
jgi:hypothetical protein